MRAAQLASLPASRALGTFPVSRHENNQSPASPPPPLQANAEVTTHVEKQTHQVLAAPVRPSIRPQASSVASGPQWPLQPPGHQAPLSQTPRWGPGC